VNQTYFVVSDWLQKQQAIRRIANILREFGSVVMGADEWRPHVPGILLEGVCVVD
jgi:hypothetical protein